MPINRVPIVHKFGIISQTQRVDLEHRIAKKAYLETRRKLETQQPPEPRYLKFVPLLPFAKCVFLCVQSVLLVWILTMQLFMNTFLYFH